MSEDAFVNEIFKWARSYNVAILFGMSTNEDTYITFDESNVKIRVPGWINSENIFDFCTEEYKKQTMMGSLK